MSKISTYANSSPVLLTDKLLGTNTAGTITNATKKGDQDRIYNGFRQSNHSGMSIDHMNSF